MQTKSNIFKKRNFLGEALDFLPPRKPGLYISRVDFFLLWISWIEKHMYIWGNFFVYTLKEQMQSN